MSATSAKRRGRKRAADYDTPDLAGLIVGHAKTSFVEGTETILVLEDKNVLDDSEDVLINPNFIDNEKWGKNAELRKKKPGYNPYDDEDLDEFGTPKHDMLSKYDEEIFGEKRQSFKLDHTGGADIAQERQLAEFKAKLLEGTQSLDSQPLRLASEYYTNDEMLKFKKPKKVRKIRKRVTPLKADDLLMASETTETDYGSRHRGRGRNKPEYEDGTSAEAAQGATSDAANAAKNDDDVDMEDMPDADDFPDDDGDIVIEEDEAEKELQAALAKTRRILLTETEKNLGADKIMELLAETEPETIEDTETDASTSKIVMDSVSEYCRGLGEMPTYGKSGNREDVEDDDMIDVELEAKKAPSQGSDDEEEKGGWFERGFDDKNRSESPKSSTDDDLSREAILDDEPEMTFGVAGALKLAVKKGYLKEDGDKRGAGASLEHLKAQRYSIVDKQFHDIDDKYAKKLERMGGGAGPIVEFKEKKDYVPDVKLKYPDEKGRLMDEKDAFRYLSWKFHGKMPAKRKIEKRMKKIMEKELLNQMSSTDTPLGTLEKQIEKQKQLQLPFIVLSGSKDAGTSIKKE